MRNSSNYNSFTKAKGLTLVELLVAISVLGFIAILGWRGLDTIVRTRLALNKDLEQTRGMQLAFSQLENDCEHIADPSIFPNKLSIAIGLERIALVRTVNIEHQPTLLKVISYRVIDSNLIREESTATRDLRKLDKDWLAATNDIVANSSKQNPSVVLQTDVSSMAMRLWSTGNWQTGTQAIDPDSKASFSLLPPTGLEVTLKFIGHNTGIKKIFLLGAV